MSSYPGSLATCHPQPGLGRQQKGTRCLTAFQACMRGYCRGKREDLTRLDGEHALGDGIEHAGSHSLEIFALVDVMEQVQPGHAV
jgi:hypothetical protein